MIAPSDVVDGGWSLVGDLGDVLESLDVVEEGEELSLSQVYMEIYCPRHNLAYIIGEAPARMIYSSMNTAANEILLDV